MHLLHIIGDCAARAAVFVNSAGFSDRISNMNSRSIAVQDFVIG